MAKFKISEYVFILQQYGTLSSFFSTSRLRFIDYKFWDVRKKLINLSKEKNHTHIPLEWRHMSVNVCQIPTTRRLVQQRSQANNKENITGPPVTSRPLQKYSDAQRVSMSPSG